MEENLINSSDDEILDQPNVNLNILVNFLKLFIIMIKFLQESSTIETISTFRQRPVRCPRTKYESLDYDVCENKLWEKEQISINSRFTIRKDLARWIVSLFIGILTALVGCIIAISIEEISLYKYSYLQQGESSNNFISSKIIFSLIKYLICSCEK